MLFLKLLRVKQWIKNIFVLVPLIFSLKFTELDSVYRALLAFASFCLVSSFVYIVNDIMDKKNDVLHPKKKERPIASGKISVGSAILTAVFCLVAGFVLSRFVSEKTSVVMAVYVLLNILYSWELKKIPIIDVLCIAFGFVLRVYAGAYSIDVSVSDYLFLTILFLSMFLAFGKRKAEIQKLGAVSRKSLETSLLAIIDKYLAILCNAVIVSYALYVVDSSASAKFGARRLIYSIVFIIYGMFRYLDELEKSSDFDDPTDNLYRDKPLIATGLLYVAYILLLFTGAI